MLSIIIPTLGRKKQLEDLLISIEKQKYNDYEVIVVDQNPPGYLEDIIIKFNSKIRLKHMLIHQKGAAHARNIGADEAKGDILFFPDDDSKLFDETITLAIEVLHKLGCECIFGKTINESGQDSVINYSATKGYLTLSDYEGKFVEATMFIKTDIFKQYYYDSSFGVGTFYGAEEAHDLVIRMLKDDRKIYYTKDIKMYHPSKILNYNDPQEIKRVFTYRCGFAHLCIKHNMKFKLLKRIILVSLYLIYLSVLNRKKSRYYFSELLGLFTGIVIRN